MLNTDKALDLLPYVVDIYEKLEIDKYIEDKKKAYKKNPVSQTQAGVELFKHIFKNAAKVKAEIIAIVSIMEEKSTEEIAKQNFAQTVIELKNLIMDKETTDFFRQAVQ